MEPGRAIGRGDCRRGPGRRRRSVSSQRMAESPYIDARRIAAISSSVSAIGLVFMLLPCDIGDDGRDLGLGDAVGREPRDGQAGAPFFQQRDQLGPRHSVVRRRRLSRGPSAAGQGTRSARALGSPVLALRAPSHWLSWPRRASPRTPPHAESGTRPSGEATPWTAPNPVWARQIPEQSAGRRHPRAAAGSPIAASTPRDRLVVPEQEPIARRHQAGLRHRPRRGIGARGDVGLEQLRQRVHAVAAISSGAAPQQSGSTIATRAIRASSRNERLNPLDRGR